MSESNNEVQIESRCIFPFNLYVATIWKATNNPTTRFVKALELGYTLYTNGVKSGIERKGFGIFENTDMISVVCKEVSPEALLAYQTEIEKYRDAVSSKFSNALPHIDESLRSLTSVESDNVKSVALG